MNPKEIEYTLAHYQTRSVKEMAGELRMHPKDLRRELRKILSESRVRAAEEPRRASVLHPGLWFHVCIVAAMLAFTCLLFFPSLEFPLLNWDDPRYVTENPLIRFLSAENLKAMFMRPHFSLYIPLTLVSYAVDYQFTYFDPTGYHATNIILHLANAGLVYALVATLTGEWLVALAVSFFFGIHPVQIESVVWIAERKNVLSSFFFLLSFFTYALTARSGKRGGILLLSWLLFAAACFSKPNVVILPLLLAAYDACFGNRHGERILRYVPYIALAFLFFLITCQITRGEGKMLYHGGSFAATFLTMLVALMRYLGLLAWPAHQSLLYEFPVYPSIAHPEPGLSFLALLALGTALLMTAVKDRKLFFWAAWYWILLLPVMNFVPFPSLMNDRYLYLPMIGFFTFLGLLAVRVLGRVPAAVIFAGLLFVFSSFQGKRLEVWADPETLWLETQAKMGGTHTGAYLNLGMFYLAQGRTDDAIAQFEKVLRMEEDPNATVNLGSAYYRKGDFNKAVEYFKKAAAMPEVASGARNNLGRIYWTRREFDLAIGEFKEAIRLSPQDPVYYNNLGSLLLEMDRDEEARQYLQAASKLDPDFAASLYNLGLLYYKKGDLPTTQQHWSRLLKLHPDYEENAGVHQRLGVAFATEGETEKAFAYLKESLRLGPNSEETHKYLGVLLAEEGRAEEAVVHFREAVRLNPDSAEAHTNLGAALDKAGKRGEAIASYEKAVALDPDYELARRNLEVARQRLERQKGESG